MKTMKSNNNGQWPDNSDNENINEKPMTNDNE
jgi:hypothetical protein